MGRQPALFGLTALFHTLLILTPLFASGHQIAFQTAWQVSPLAFAESITDGMTIGLLICVVLFVARRVADPNVRALSAPGDYLLLCIVAVPFLTGLLAYHQIGHYRTMMILHILSGQVMLLAVGFTKLGHMMFFFVARFWVRSEHTLGGGTRTW